MGRIRSGKHRQKLKTLSKNHTGENTVLQNDSSLPDRSKREAVRCSGQEQNVQEVWPQELRGTMLNESKRREPAR